MNGRGIVSPACIYDAVCHGTYTYIGHDAGQEAVEHIHVHIMVQFVNSISAWV